jgi:hypothetical protein
VQVEEPPVRGGVGRDYASLIPHLCSRGAGEDHLGRDGRHDRQ